MIKIYASEDRVLIHHLHNMLMQDGIETVIKNDLLFTLAGEVPATECWPELWLADEKLLSDAEKLIQKSINNNTGKHQRWVCDECNEALDGQFTQCWNCGHERELTV